MGAAARFVRLTLVGLFLLTRFTLALPQSSEEVLLAVNGLAATRTATGMSSGAEHMPMAEGSCCIMLL